MKEAQFQKKGIALIYLAKKFFTLSVGDRVPTVDELCKDTNTSRGTMQNALETLKMDRAIKTISKGHMGTYLLEQNRDKLLSYMINKNIVCAMPLPYTKHYEGMSTAFYKSFEESQLSLNLAYVNGSINRLNGLLTNRFDFIMTSGLTADYLINRYDVQLIKMFSDETNVSTHVLIHRKNSNEYHFKGIHDGMNIGVDSHSIDYKLLTQEIVKNHDVNLIETPYNQMVQRIGNGSLDAAIWNRDEISEKNYPVDYESINSSYIEKASRAALLCRKDDDFTKEIVKKYSDTSKIVLVQNAVISGKILPEY
ncbi:GntR family transcriptional regulator YhfZ [Companilactobacillus futsaii]|uniref:GntR family transcriptional regulator n=2 Tax=Companilactobacillus futsaii TaxID=938155 RepID=A0A5B7T5I4_9LACO|nr:GntR family transcriptional regulator YhfZ [Companilactobacillus futsaii]KRK95585.1 GntR family transcriptional regulator [Companilactobacillus futsaii JCM 17355]QCX25799.1 GntR family transcriptional regulator [Companilactobacillus futsaii]